MANLFEVRSKFNRAIRLTDTIWYNKVLQDHPEFTERPEYVDDIKKAIEDPDYVIEGYGGEVRALRWCSVAPGRPKYLCVVYREFEQDGFVITAYFTSKVKQLVKRTVLWKRTK